MVLQSTAKKIQRKTFHKRAAAALTIAAITLSQAVTASAAGGTILPVEVFGKDIVSVGIPVIAEGEKSPFDFILDPQGLLYTTNAMRYGGGTVEEGATLLFHNSSGGYDFSRYSDKLTVTNESTVPVTVTISAYVSNLDGISLTENEDFSGNESQSIYLAIVDDEGHTRPISANGETAFSWEMEAAPENAYVYALNEAAQTYERILSGSAAEIGFDTYSFGLVGACNPNVDWKKIAIHPTVTVVWRVEPILPEPEGPADEAAKDPEERFGEDVWEVLRNQDTGETKDDTENPSVKDWPTENTINRPESKSKEELDAIEDSDGIKNPDAKENPNQAEDTADQTAAEGFPEL